MGVLIHLSEDKLSKGKVFFDYFMEIYQSGKLFVIPMGNGGYCIAANPFKTDTMQEISQFFGEFPEDNLIFIGQDKTILSSLTKPPRITYDIADKFWPDNIILQLPKRKKAKPFGKFSLNQDFWDGFDRINIFIAGNNFLIQHIFSILKDHGYPPLLLGFYPLVNTYYNPHEILEVFQQFEPDIIKLGFNVGYLQKGGKRSRKVLTVLRIDSDRDLEAIELGIISGEDLTQFIKTIPLYEEEEGDNDE